MSETREAATSKAQSFKFSFPFKKKGRQQFREKRDEFPIFPQVPTKKVSTYY